MYFALHVDGCEQVFFLSVKFCDGVPCIFFGFKNANLSILLPNSAIFQRPKELKLSRNLTS